MTREIDQALSAVGTSAVGSYCDHQKLDYLSKDACSRNAIVSRVHVPGKT